MRKSFVVLLLFIEIILLFFFSNINSLLSEVIKTETKQIELKTTMPDTSLNIIKSINKFFKYFIIILAIFLLATGVYLIYLLSSKKNKPELPKIPQLQNYLFQLKSNETELKTLVEQQQKKAISADELSRIIINSMDVAIILANASNKIEIFNREAERIFGKSLAFAKNNDVNIIISDFPEILKAIEKNKTREVLEMKSNGFELKIEIIPMPEIGLLLIIDDVTEERKKKAIIQKNRNFIMLGEMTAFLVHEVRNSLGIIYGYARTIKDNTGKIEKVSNEIIFLTEMMERFLNFSKPLKEGSMVEVNINNLLKEIGEKYKLKILINGVSLLLKIDYIQIETVFSNLFRNSFEAGATIIEIDIEDKPNIKITLKDNGKGIKDENIEKIWLPFFTTRAKGTGMGLALVKKSVTHLNGDINIIKTSPQGTEFQIELYR